MDSDRERTEMATPRCRTELGICGHREEMRSAFPNSEKKIWEEAALSRGRRSSGRS